MIGGVFDGNVKIEKQDKKKRFFTKWICLKGYVEEPPKVLNLS